MYRIGQAAKLLGVTPKTLRVWEKEGKIHPLRTPGNQRRYPKREIERLLSGLNENRRGLRRLLKMAREGKIDKVVVEFQDRLARFGFKYLETYFAAFDVQVEVTGGNEPKSLQQELVDDMPAILASFSAKLYGHRSRRFRKRVREAMKDVEEDG